MISVTCAIIRNDDNEILIVQRGKETDHPLKWEFPGGKISPGEKEEDCIIREIDEELSMDIIICEKLLPVEYDYGNKQIRLIPFLCDTLNEAPLLSEHLDYKWIPPENLLSVDFSEADVLIAAQYVENLRESGDARGSVTEETPLDNDDSGLGEMINKIMSRKEAEWIATSAVENPVIFSRLLRYSFSNDKKLAFKASWALTKVCDKFPAMIYPHLSNIISMLDSIDNESVQRSFLRIISLTDFEIISRKQFGILADHCFRALNSGFSAISVKAYSMEIIYKLCIFYPELAYELYASVNMLREDGPAGVKARGQLILKKLEDINPDLKSSQQES
jgi:8-oxo-dGTP diphosphatase